MQIFDEKYPNNGMNRDDEVRLVEPNESRYVLNMRAGSSDDDNVGAIENIKGTTQVSFQLPDGSNKCIGSFGDQTTNSNFFFIYNSLGNHSIYRYFPDNRTVRLLAKDSLFNFQEDDLINDIRVVDGKLLKWRDVTNPPRKINLVKADTGDPNFRQTFNWYLGDKYLEGQSILLMNVQTRTNRYATSVGNANYTFTINQSLGKKDLAKDLANQINAINTVNWEAEACGEFIHITMTDNQFYSLFSLNLSSNKTNMIVPQNHYQTYIERTIDEIKHPPHCELKGLIRTDETFERNYIKEKVFQFAARYIYDDDEKSTISPYSVHIYNKYTCSQFQGESINNYIELDLSVYKEISNLNDLQTIKRIEIFVREGKEGKWQSFKTLEQFEFVDISDQHVDFYNDGIYDTEDQINFVRPYDFVPQRTKNMEVVKNRTFFANNLEGYDNVCTDANIDIEYDDVESRVKAPTYDVSGVLLIRAMFNGSPNDGSTNGRTPAKYQGIYRDMLLSPPTGSLGGTTDQPIVWGGISEGAGQDPNVDEMARKTGQILPRGGFTVYLAATDFHAKTKQNIGKSHNNVSQDSDGVYFTNNINQGQTLIDKLRENMRNQSGASSSPLILDPSYWGDFQQFQGQGGGVDRTQVYSTFNIQNVPDGWYTLRVASHTITEEDLEDPERGWQRTSTNVYQITNLDAQDNPAIVGYRESAIKGRSELLINVRGGNIPRIKIEVMDMSHASDFGSSKIMTGYVCDNDIQTPVNSYDNIFSDTRIARANVGFDKNPGDTNYNIFPSNAYCPGKSALTDHNGYFYYGSIDSFASSGLSICQIRSHDVPNSLYGLNQIQEKTGLPTSGIGEDEYADVAIRVNPNTTTNNRVKVTGSIKDNVGVGIPKASVVAIRAEVAICDNDGDYEFWHYGILETSAGNPSLDTYLIPVRTAGSCSAFYDENQIYDFAFNYGDWWQNRPNQTAPSQISSPSGIPLTLGINSFLGDISNVATINAMKRGWDGEFGLVYLDRGNRSGAVNTEENLKIHIPFYTENDSDGVQKRGVPILNWEIKHRPPEWATHYQWVRTRNLKVGSYFQWTIKDVAYTDADGNAATFNNGTRVRLNIENIVKYKDKFPTMDLEANPDNESWRARFMKNDSGNYYTDYFDFKILEVDGDVIVIEKDFSVGEVKPGTLLEFYSDLLDIENDIFYEFGECFEVGTDSNGNRFHKGLTQDQDPINPTITPATGTFRTGDAYYRLREMPDTTVNNPAYIDDDAVSDFYPSEVESIGRPNIINPDAKQLWKPNQIRHSGKYIPDSAVNNLSQFFDTNFNALPVEYGDINKLQLAANVLMSIHEFRWVSNYIEEVLVRRQDGGDSLEATTDVFGSFRAAKQITGTINQESVVEYRGNVYAFDLNKGLVNRWGADGLTAISEYKMMNYFTDKAKDIMTNINKGSKKPSILGSYDHKFNEYILTFGQINNLLGSDIPIEDNPTYKVATDVSRTLEVPDATNETLYSINGENDEINSIVFDESKTPDLNEVQVDNRHTSNGVLKVKVKDLTGRIVDVVTLEPGQGIQKFNISNKLFKPKQQTSDTSNSNLITGSPLVKGETVAFSEVLNRWSTFYSFRPEMYGNINLEMISFVDGGLWIHNDSDNRNTFYGVKYPSQVEVVANKHPNQVKVFEALGIESYHPWFCPSMKTPNGMETTMVIDRFVRKEDSYFSSVMRDMNDPTISNNLDSIINGRQLRDRTARVLLQNDDDNEVTMFSVSILSTVSPRHQN